MKKAMFAFAMSSLYLAAHADVEMQIIRHHRGLQPIAASYKIDPERSSLIVPCTDDISIEMVIGTPTADGFEVKVAAVDLNGQVISNAVVHVEWEKQADFAIQNDTMDFVFSFAFFQVSDEQKADEAERAVNAQDAVPTPSLK